MQTKKISKKALSRNLKVKKAPLKVLPIGSFFGANRRMKKLEKEAAKQHHERRISSDNQVQCPVEDIHSGAVKNVKRSGRRKVPLTIRPFFTVRFTMNAFRWVLLLIFIYLAAGTIIVMIQDGIASMKNVVIYSVMGFFTFFMGYFGTVFARDILKVINEKKTSRDDVNIEA